MQTASMIGPYWLDPRDKQAFPDVSRALREPDGLLAVGGDLSPERLLAAYRAGIFPWFSQGQPILWWSPDPRAVLFPERLHISASLAKTLRKGRFTVSMDTDFAAVLAGCAEPRGDGLGTWITSDMRRAYQRLHALGLAHSVECRHDGELVGGLYGVALGRIFFGESMFSRMRDASKVALVHLVRQLQAWDFALIDCQVVSPHLLTLGAELIPRDRFVAHLAAACSQPDLPGPWQMDASLAEHIRRSGGRA